MSYSAGNCSLQFPAFYYKEQQHNFTTCTCQSLDINIHTNLYFKLIDKDVSEI
jgi:hypothetical protein